ncbi:MAG: GNAT family N-acetyltransferase [Saprospiraceae bacterium]|nr:GNAT family N-acetyltransferase [Saprospiraceae bacterium]MCB9322281.1 GNAT family N-acetyltransferase [Lewinellaceae bacterium]
MFKYKELAFRAIERKDLESLRLLHNDPDTFLNLASIDFIDEPGQEAWWQNLHHQKNDKRYVIVKADDHSFILGRLRIQHLDFQNNNCEVGLDIMPGMRRMGYGQKAYEMLLYFLFNHYNMNLVYLRVADFNTGSYDLYRKLGFEETGRFPQYFFRHGKYWDYVLMSLTASAYFKKVSDLSSHL